MDILNALSKHIKNEKASFHMPGHKNGTAFFGSPFYNDIFKLDTTELLGTDCLAEPESFLIDAQKKTARIYSADNAHFLVNGSTGGILSMFYASFSEGDTVICDRGCHKSAISAMMLTGIKPIYVSPDEDEEIGCSGKINPEKIEEMFKKHPEAKGVYITSPNYYGICSDIRKISEITHKHGAVILVDEAHGAHFPFSSHFPENAMACGADLAVTSLHKSLASPNQTALLFQKGERVSCESVKQAINMFQTTSPSYILMAYSDLAVSMAEKDGEFLTEKLLALSKEIKAKRTDDPFKLIISYSDKGLSGEDLDRILREKFGIYSELYDHKNVLLMTSWGNTKEDFDLLNEAISYLENLPDKRAVLPKYPRLKDAEPTLSPKEISKKETKKIPLVDAKDKILAKTITTFPPCIPVILAGEKITQEHIDFLSEFGGKITGMDNGEVEILR